MNHHAEAMAQAAASLGLPLDVAIEIARNVLQALPMHVADAIEHRQDFAGLTLPEGVDRETLAWTMARAADVALDHLSAELDQRSGLRWWQRERGM